MMSAMLVSIFLTIGACTWIYNKFQRYTGNDTRRSAIATTVAGFMIFIVSYYFFDLITG